MSFKIQVRTGNDEWQTLVDIADGRFDATKPLVFESRVIAEEYASRMNLVSTNYRIVDVGKKDTGPNRYAY